MIKALDGPFDAATGQLVLEAFTYDEGTYPATACDFVARTVFAAPVPPERRLLHRRSVLMLLDGMTLEADAQDYRSALRGQGIDLLVLNIKVRGQGPRCSVPARPHGLDGWRYSIQLHVLWQALVAVPWVVNCYRDRLSRAHPES